MQEPAKPVAPTPPSATQTPSPTPRPAESGSRPTVVPVVPDSAPVGDVSPAEPAKQSSTSSTKSKGKQPGEDAVRKYLNALDKLSEKPGLTAPQRRRLEARRTSLEKKIRESSRWEQLNALPELEEVAAQLAVVDKQADLEAKLQTLEGDFVTHAKTYAEAAGIPQHFFQKVGVPRAVLKRAGLTVRGRQPAEDN